MVASFHHLSCWLTLCFVITPSSADTALDFEAIFGSKVRSVQGTVDPADDLALAAELLQAAAIDALPPESVKVLCEQAYQLASKVANRKAESWHQAVAALELLASRCPAEIEEVEERLQTIWPRQIASAPADQRASLASSVVDRLLARGDRLAESQFEKAITSYRMALSMAIQSKLSNEAQIRARIEASQYRQRVRLQVQQWSEKLLSQPLDQALRHRIIEILVMELDSPADANRYLTKEADAQLIRFVTLAISDGRGASPEESFKLAEWYLSFESKASTAAKPAILIRARSYFRRYLAIQREPNLFTSKATLEIKAIDVRLQELGIDTDSTPGNIARTSKVSNNAAPATVRSQPVDLIALADIKKHAIAGKWERRGNELIVKADKGHERLYLPYALTENYELTVEFEQTGGDAVAVMFPVGSGSLTLSMGGWKTGKHGLEHINGKALFSDRTGLALNKNHTVVITCRVLSSDKVELAIKLDGNALFLWIGSPSQCAIKKEWALPSKGGFGVGSSRGDVTFRSVQLRALSN